MSPRSFQPRRGALLRAVLIVTVVALGVITLAQRLMQSRDAATRVPAPPPRPHGFGEVVLPGLAPNATVEIGGVMAESLHGRAGQCARETGSDGGGDTVRCRLPAGELRSVVVHVPGYDEDWWTIMVPDEGGRSTLVR